MRNRSKCTRLEQLRHDLGMTKADVAREARMQGNVIGWIESRRFVPYPSQLAKIADAVGWEGDPEELLEEADGDDDR